MRRDISITSSPHIGTDIFTFTILLSNGVKNSQGTSIKMSDNNNNFCDAVKTPFGHNVRWSIHVNNVVGHGTGVTCSVTYNVLQVRSTMEDMIL